MRHPTIYTRSLEPDDLSEVAALLDACLDHDDVSVDWVREKTVLDPDYDPLLTLCAFDAGALVGFAQGVVREAEPAPRGCIKWFATTPASRRRGVATALLDRVERVMRRQGVQQVCVAALPPNYTMPGIDPRYTEACAFLERRGYVRTGEAFNMTCDLTSSDWATGPDEERLGSLGIDIRRAERSDLPGVRDHVLCHYPGWVREVAACFLRAPISLHIAVARADSRVVGFAAYDANNVGMGWFGPMGTDPAWRAHGIGSVLLRRCLADQLAQGHERAIIPWVGPFGFYRRQCGAVVSRTFWQMEKRLDG